MAGIAFLPNLPRNETPQSPHIAPASPQHSSLLASILSPCDSGRSLGDLLFSSPKKRPATGTFTTPTLQAGTKEFPGSSGKSWTLVKDDVEVESDAVCESPLKRTIPSLTSSPATPTSSLSHLSLATPTFRSLAHMFPPGCVDNNDTESDSACVSPLVLPSHSSTDASILTSVIKPDPKVFSPSLGSILTMLEETNATQSSTSTTVEPNIAPKTPPRKRITDSAILNSPVEVGNCMSYHFAQHIPSMSARDAKKLANKRRQTVAPPSAEDRARILKRYIKEIRAEIKNLQGTSEDINEKVISVAQATIKIWRNCQVEVIEVKAGIPRSTLFGWHEVILKDGKRRVIPHPINGDDVYTLSGAALHTLEESIGWRMPRPTELALLAIPVDRTDSSSSDSSSITSTPSPVAGNNVNRTDSPSSDSSSVASTPSPVAGNNVSSGTVSPFLGAGSLVRLPVKRAIFASV